MLSNSVSLSRVQERLKLFSYALSRWSRRTFKKREKLIKEKIELLRKMQLNEGSKNREEVRNSKRELGIMLE